MDVQLLFVKLCKSKLLSIHNFKINLTGKDITQYCVISSCIVLAISLLHLSNLNIIYTRNLVKNQNIEKQRVEQVVLLSTNTSQEKVESVPITVNSEQSLPVQVEQTSAVESSKIVENIKAPEPEKVDPAIEKINREFKSTRLKDLGESIVTLSKKKNIDPYLVAALAAYESNWGKSNIAVKKNNLFGLRAYDKDPFKNALAFKTKEDSIEYFLDYMNRMYYNKGIKDLDKIGKIYSSNPNWSNDLKDLMKQFKN